MTVRAVVLDVNETLFSLDAVRDRFADVGLDPDDLPLWFAQVLRDGFAATAAGGFVAFPDLARHHLGALLPDEVDADAAADHVIGGFELVTAHPDVRPALESLRASDVTVATLTNGTASITRDFLDREGLSDLVATVMEVGEVGTWKPGRAAYDHALERLGTTAEETALVAVHPWDVHGAMQAGLVGTWVDRGERTWPSYWDHPDHEVDSLTAAVAALAA